MTAFLSNIISRQKAFPGDVAGLNDFTLAPAQAVAADLVLSSPDWSLYCIDVARNLAMFVELPAGYDLSQAAFVYMTQHDLARRAVVMPLDQLAPLSLQVALPQTFGILFSTGRCGSTLASHILAQVPGVWSLSEPDALENLAFARLALPLDQRVRLLRAVTRLLCRPPAGRQISTIVLKPRGESVIQVPDFALALPFSRNVFMYRDAAGFTNSLYQFVQKLIGPEAFFGSRDAWTNGWKFASANAPFDILDSYFPEGWQDIGYVEMSLVAWVLRIDAYLDALKNGITMQPRHYQDLNTNRRTETARLLAAFGIAPDHLDLALRGFDKDSQEGTGGDRALPARPIDAVQRQRIAGLLADWGKADYLDQRLPAGG